MSGHNREIGMEFAKGILSLRGIKLIPEECDHPELP